MKENLNMKMTNLCETPSEKLLTFPNFNLYQGHVLFYFNILRYLAAMFPSYIKQLIDLHSILID